MSFKMCSWLMQVYQQMTPVNGRRAPAQGIWCLRVNHYLQHRAQRSIPRSSSTQNRLAECNTFMQRVKHYSKVSVYMVLGCCYVCNHLNFHEDYYIYPLYNWLIIVGITMPKPRRKCDISMNYSLYRKPWEESIHSQPMITKLHCKIPSLYLMM